MKRAGDADAVFAPVEIAAGAAVGHLAARASATLGWRVGADKIRLFLAKQAGDDDEPSAAEEEAALAGPRLGVGWLLPRARVTPGTWLVARLPDAPAPAAGPAAGPHEAPVAPT